MKKIIVETKYGNFTMYQEIKKINFPTIIFLPAMGISSSYYDYFTIFEDMSNYDVNVISLDLLGLGLSGNPKYKIRNLKNISKELIYYFNGLEYPNIYIVSHSFSSMYILNIYNQINIKGLIFIDPTIPQFMIENSDEIKYELNDAINDKTIEVDLNPLLPEDIKQQAKSFYQKVSGNQFEISQLNEAIITSENLLNTSIVNIKTLNFISTLNFEEYISGNPYFSNHENSLEVVLNGHHFLQWLHTKKIINQIINFIFI